MRSKYFRLWSVVSILLLAMMACNLGTPGEAPTLPPQASATIPEQIIPTATEPPMLLPTETATPDVTATRTLRPTMTLTPTIAIPVAEVVKEMNCRVGPGGAYNLVVILKPGDTVDVLARDLGGGFVFVQPPDVQVGCWALENGLTVDGNLTPLPAFSPPPSPTLSPSFEVEYKNTDICRGVFTRFVVTNNGSVQFRSAYVKVTNLRNGEVAEHAVNAFDLTTKCIVAQNIAPLTPGSTGYLQSPVFIKDPRGQKMLAVFSLCVEQNLKGGCVNQTLEFTAK